ncbi:MAG TPA: DNA glycosylase [Candidatus Bathyarchaeia archaeon]|nr:DNA glycosylase [Candidatus Bathyarchaeia archaeon]
MKIRLDYSCPFNLDFTFCCGQTFRWDKQGYWWYGAAGDTAFKIRQLDDGLEFENAEAVFVKNYLGLHDDLPKIFNKISKDEHIKKAIQQFRGLRILRQDPWECLISYICATYKNIPAIKRMLLNLSRKFGEKVSLDGYTFHTFPTAERLARAKTDELADCGLGFRTKYVSETARIVNEDNFDFEKLKKMTYEEATTELLNFTGVGLKVADCVSLFSLEKLEAFPVDVWMRRVILRHYTRRFPDEFIKKISGEKPLSTSDYRKLNLFGKKYFGEYAGYAQEYLYHYERMQR